MLPALDAGATLALRVWKKLGGELNWAALPVLIELYEVEDPEALIDDLTTLRDQLAASRNAK